MGDADKICSIDGCERVTVAKSLCNMHYQRLRLHGNTDEIIHYKVPVNGETIKSLIHYDTGTGIMFRKYIENGNGHIKSDGYAVMKIYGIEYKKHRLAWLYVYGQFPTDQIDHINGIKSDNRIVNLRLATHRINSRNRAIPKSNTSGSIGVTLDKASNQWVAQISIYGKHVKLGRFDDKSEAICVRMAANIHYGFHRNHGRAA